MKNLKINHLAAWLFSAIGWCISGGWYAAFGDAWLQLIRRPEAEFKGRMDPWPYVLAFVAALGINYLLAWFFKVLKVESAVTGLGIAMLCWVFFLFLPTLTQDIFSHDSYQLTLINAGSYLGYFFVSGLGLGAWRKYE